MPEKHPMAGGALSQSQPFPGLRPYEEVDADWFFGRSNEINDLLKRLRRLHFIAIVGASGCGKSSLVRAGLLPQIRNGFLDADWRIVVFRPGERPIANLAEAMGPEIVSDPADSKSVLRSGELGLVRAIHAAKLTGDAKVFILVDQFEEIFQFAQRTGDSGQEEVKEFLKLLLAAAASDDVDVYVALTMRLEWLNECTSYDGLAEAINAGIYLVPQMQRRQFGQAIQGPLEAANAGLTSALFGRMLNDLDNKADQLPVMQHALLRLWERNAGNAPLDIAGYEAAGTFSSCLSAHAEEVYGELTGPEQRVAEMLFRTITQVSKNRRIRRALPLSEIMKTTRLGFDELGTVIEAFSKAGRSFLVTTQGALTPASVVDISHEALIRQWERLKHWVDNEKETQARLRRLEQDATDWNKDRAGMKDCLYSGVRLLQAEELLPHLEPNNLSAVFLKESRRAYFWLQLRRRGWAGVAALLLVGLSIGFALVSRERARQAEAVSNAEALATKAQREKDKAVQDTFVRQVQQANGSATKLAAIAQNLQAPRIFIKVFQGQEDLARTLQAQFSRSGFTVPQTDYLPPNATKQETQVGYYYPEDQANAASIAALVRQKVPGGLMVQLIPNPKDVVPRGQFEVSIAAPAPTALTPTPPISAQAAANPAKVEPPPPPVAPPPTLTATVSQTSVQQGGSITITWDAENASEVDLSDYGRVPLKGSLPLTPQRSQTYTLTAKGDGGSIDKPLNITVTAPAVPPPITPIPVATVDLAAVRAALNSYKEAYESESPGDMLKIWPTLRGAPANDMKAIFNNYNAIRLTLDCDNPHIEGSTATIKCKQTFLYTMKGRVQDPVHVNATFSLRKNGATWLIDDRK
jgi:energy-coupling factor transporter ATP-binding protein EcfA2